MRIIRSLIVAIVLVCAVLMIPYSSNKTCNTVKLGTGLKTGQEFLDAFTRNNCWVSYYARKVILSPAFKIAEKEMKLDLAVVSVAELGFRDGGRAKEIYARAAEKGLVLCPAEVGPQLRLQYKDQPVGEVLIIAMESHPIRTGYSVVFHVEHLSREEYALFLSVGNEADEDVIYPAHARFIFVWSK